MAIGFHFDDMEEALLGINEEELPPTGAAFHEDIREREERERFEKAWDRPIGAAIHDDDDS
jgi:hypothetical protein